MKKEQGSTLSKFMPNLKRVFPASTACRPPSFVNGGSNLLDLGVLLAQSAAKAVSSILSPCRTTHSGQLPIAPLLLISENVVNRGNVPVGRYLTGRYSTGSELDSHRLIPPTLHATFKSTSTCIDVFKATTGVSSCILKRKHNS